MSDTDFSPPRYVLALDSALSGCSAALYDTQEVRGVSHSSDAPRGQAEFLVPLAKRCIDDAGIEFDNVDLITTLRGPGSFTGLRVALSAAKSFALALDIPLVGLVTSDVLIQQGAAQIDKDATRVCVLMETKRSDYYVQIYDRALQPCMEVSALELDAVLGLLDGEDCYFIGDALNRFEKESGIVLSARNSKEILQINTELLANMGYQYYHNHRVSENLEPLYLRGADVSQPKVAPKKLKS